MGGPGGNTQVAIETAFKEEPSPVRQDANELYSASAPDTVRFKRDAVRLVRSSPSRSIARIARKLGVSDNSLRSWINQIESEQGEREGLTTQEREELRRLRKENKVLRQEQEILRKAITAFFAREDEIR